MNASSYKFLVDVNLPKYFSFFNSKIFVHIRDIDKKFTDEEIWDYALKYDYVILTKDADFFEKSFLSASKPKVVHFQLHNFTLSELHEYFSDNWDKIVSLLDSAALIEAKKDSIRVVL